MFETMVAKGVKADTVMHLGDETNGLTDSVMLVISCHILSYLVISCHILSYLVISRLTLFFSNLSISEIRISHTLHLVLTCFDMFRLF